MLLVIFMDLKLILLLPIVLLIIAIRPRPIFSIRNVSLVGFPFMLLLGTILLPTAILMDNFYPENQKIFVEAVEKSILATNLALLAFISTFILLDKSQRQRDFSKIALNYQQITEKVVKTKFIKAYSSLCLLSFVGITLIMIVFIKTGHIPYTNIDNPAKYFEGFTDKYISFRPLYVIGQQLLSISGIFLLLFFLEGRGLYKIMWGILMLMDTFTLVLTLKRGEIFLPFIIVFGGMLFNMVRITREKILSIVLIVLLLFGGAVLTEPTGKYRPFTRQINQLILKEAHPVVKAEEPTKKVKNFNPAAKTSIDFFGVQIRETARLIYNFELSGQSYYYGKTYLAAFLGFLPTKYFDFKENYLIGRVVLQLYGQDKETSGGPRVGIMGEGYINLGYLGVIISAVIVGIIAWFLDKLQYEYIMSFAETKLTAMTGLFFVFIHLVWGIFLDGSAAIQTFIIRSILISIILMCFLKISRLQNRSL